MKIGWVMAKIRAGCYGIGLSGTWSLRVKGTAELGQVNSVSSGWVRDFLWLFPSLSGSLAPEHLLSLCLQALSLTLQTVKGEE